MNKKIKLSDHFNYHRLLRFVFPSIIMMVFTSIYGVVDGFFVSNFAGKTSFAAINLIMPFLMIIGGVGFMLGTGGSALAAKSLGEGKDKDANRYFTMMVCFTVVLGVILSILGFIFIRPIAYFLKATDDMIEDCVTYGRIILVFNTAFMLQNVFQSFFVAAEKPKLGLKITLVSGVCNMILDALFIAFFKWGIVGAAVATGISQLVGGVLPIIYFIRPNSSLLRFTKTPLKFSPLFKACVNGSSELMSSISGSVVSMVYNFQLIKFLGEDGIASYGVLMYVQFIFVAISIGYSIGCAPIVSYHYGAENHSELKNILIKSLIMMSISGVALTLIAQIFASPLAKMFVGYDKELTTITIQAFRISSFSFLLAGINIFASSFFTALNNGAISAIISFLRTLVFQTSCVIVLPLIFDVVGIWWAIVVAELFALIISTIFLVAKKNTYHYL